MISMALVQDDGDGHEHVIYYLSRNLLDPETRYAYVEKLALAMVQAVQCFLHCIIMHTVKVNSNCNPMTFILSRKFLGANTRSGLLASKILIWNLLLPSLRNH